MNSSNVRTALWTTVVVLVLAFAYYQYNVSKIKPDKTQSAMSAAAKQRFEKWAYVAKGKELSPGEFIRLVIIPSASGIEVLDTKCIIYTNTEFRKSQMICPNSLQTDIDYE